MVDHHILIAKYLGGTATPEDRRMLESWIAESEENDRYFIEMSILFSETKLKESHRPSANKAQAKQKLQGHIYRDANNREPLNVDNRVLLAPKTKRWMAVAASLLVLLGITLAYKYRAGNDYVYTTAQTERQERLPDSAIIKLASNSRAVYKTRLGDAKKYINLEGKAFFEISNASSGNVVVCADEVFIHDIGTAFTVEAYKNSSIVRVTVKSGMVDFYTASNKGLMLKEGEVGVYDRISSSFKKEINRILKTTGPVSSSLENDSTHSTIGACEMTVAKLISKLNKKYHANIKLAEPKLGDEQMTVTFDGTESLDLVLQVVAQSMDMSVKKVGNDYYLSKKQ